MAYIFFFRLYWLGVCARGRLGYTYVEVFPTQCSNNTNNNNNRKDEFYCVCHKVCFVRLTVAGGLIALRYHAFYTYIYITAVASRIIPSVCDIDDTIRERENWLNARESKYQSVHAYIVGLVLKRCIQQFVSCMLELHVTPSIKIHIG